MLSGENLHGSPFPVKLSATGSLACASLTRRELLALLGLAPFPIVAAPRSAPAAGTGKAEFYDLIRARRMVRSFRPDDIPRLQLERLLDAAVRAPSAGNLQPWEFILVREPKRKRSLARAALGQIWLATAPLVVVACANEARSAARYGRRGAEFYSVIDTAFASLMLLLAATAEGLGACFVGAFEDAKVKGILALPDNVRPVGIIPVGFPAEGEPTRRGKTRLRRPFYYEQYGREAGKAKAIRRGATSRANASGSPARAETPSQAAR